VGTLLAGVLLLVGALLVPVATTGWWLRTDLVSSDGYVDTVTPLATDPAIVRAVEDLLVEATLRSVDRSDLVSRVDQALTERGLPADALRELHQLTGSTESRVRVLVERAVHAVVTSPGFVTVWRSANQVAHHQLLAALRGRSSAVQRGLDSTVDVRLDALSGPVRHALTDAGVPFASSLPAVTATYPLGSVHDLHRARAAYAALDRGTMLVPAVTIALLLLGLLVAGRRRGPVLFGAVVSLLGPGLVLAALAAAKALYVDAAVTHVPSDAARAVIDVVTSGLRRDLVVVAVVVAVLAALAVLVPRRFRDPRHASVG
jgi:hypothetical protein